MRYRGIVVNPKEKNFKKAIQNIDEYWNSFYKRKRQHTDFLYVIAK